MSGKKWNTVFIGLVAWIMMVLSIQADANDKDVVATDTFSTIPTLTMSVRSETNYAQDEIILLPGWNQLVAGGQ